MRKILVRKAHENDYPEIFALLEEAFKDDEHSEQNEAAIVANLKGAPDFIPEFSLVALDHQMVIGYLLLTPVRIEDNSTSYPVLALAPVAVLPEWQQKGVGTLLMEHAHQKAMAANFDLIVVIGHASYYPRFGYREAKEFDISVPFDIPSQYVMIRELQAGAGQRIQGRVKYPSSFYL